MERLKWLVINYTLPTEPSRVRVAAWRSLKKLGAVNIQQSMWILPYDEKNREALHAAAQELEKNHGDALVMQSSFFSENDEKKVLTRFNKARDEEYKELLEQCDDFFQEIRKEVGRSNFTFAEVEENEEELEKLQSWYAKIKVRDTFGADLGEKAAGRLEECRQLLDEFSGRVFQFNDGNNTDHSP